MTWIIGTSTVFGYGILLSDTRVTYTDLRTGEVKIKDAVRKAFSIAPFIAGGFAGSIKIGFELIDDLRNFLILPEDEKNSAWRIDWVARHWQSRAKEIFERSSANEQKSGSHVLLLGAHPTEDVGIPGFAKIQMVIFKSPDFVPDIKEGGLLVIESIGSGADIYIDELERICSKDDDIIRTENLGFGGMGVVLTHYISEYIREHPTSSVGSHLHSIVLRRGAMTEGRSDFVRHHQDGTVEEFKMPGFAESYNELLEIFQIEDGDASLIA